jgi:hypothetical protein
MTNWKIVPSEFQLPQAARQRWEHLTEAKTRPTHFYPIGAVIEASASNNFKQSSEYLIVSSESAICFSSVSHIKLSNLLNIYSRMIGRLTTEGVIEYFADTPVPRPVTLKEIPDLTIVRVKGRSDLIWRVNGGSYFGMFNDGSCSCRTQYEVNGDEEVLEVIGRMEFTQ